MLIAGLGEFLEKRLNLAVFDENKQFLEAILSILIDFHLFKTKK